MGLDMYLIGRKFDPKREDIVDGFTCREKLLDLGYWRKHPNLHGYIVEHFAENGVDDCKPIDLSAENIEQIIEAIRENDLPETEGFLFGESSKDEEQVAEDVRIFEAALAWVASTEFWHSVEYRASW